MVKKIILILVFLFFILFMFSETSADQEKVEKKKHFKQDCVKYGKTCKKEPKVIEIQTISVEESMDGKSTIGKRYYLFHTKGVAKGKKGAIEKPKKMKKFKNKSELFAKSGNFYKEHPNLVSTVMDRGEKIYWKCEYPFTIFYGGRSILTTDKQGWARPGKIISYLQGVKRGENWYQTPDAWIVNNALSGAYKYFVSVYIPEAGIILVDDPETIVPRPKRN
ncbi:MAG: hypothetical protein ABFR75_10430 [Acidobacteriota bacterium]